MQHANQTHPAPEQLHAFALGQLSAGDLAEIEAHIGDCAECAARLADVPDDSFVGRLRGQGTSDTIPPDQGAVSCIDLPAGLIDHPRYRIQRVLGAGGMGVVYLAFHRLLERAVAVKVINAGLVSNPLALERFRQEFKAAGQLSHPNIIAAHDAEQVGGVHFLVMEYVDGISLDRLVVKQGPLPVEQACHFIRQAALGLQHAHEKGMVHRDIKPHNLMVTRKGQVKVLDFGLARLKQEGTGDRPLTTLGVVLGTPDYIAPEQVSDSRGVDIRADIYSLGCTLYFLLCGQPPFPEGSAIEKALSHVDGMPRPLRTLRAEVPAELAALVERMMAKSPDQRYQTPDDVARALAAFARTGSAASRPAPPPPVPVPDEVEVEAPRPRRRPRRRPEKAAFPLGTALMLGGVGLGAMVFLVALLIIVPRLSNLTGIQPNPRQPLIVAAAAPRILLVVPRQQFWWPDYDGVMTVLRENRAEVVVASSQPGHAFSADNPPRSLPVDVALHEVRGGDYDAIIFCGGVPDKIEFVGQGAAAQSARRVINEAMKTQRPVTAICAGTIVLADAGALEGRKATGYHTVHKKLAAKGATLFPDEDVVEDGSIITGSNPLAARAFTERVLLRVRQKPR